MTKYKYDFLVYGVITADTKSNAKELLVESIYPDGIVQQDSIFQHVEFIVEVE